MKLKWKDVSVITIVLFAIYVMSDYPNDVVLIKVIVLIVSCILFLGISGSDKIWKKLEDG